MWIRSRILGPGNQPKIMGIENSFSIFLTDFYFYSLELIKKEVNIKTPILYWAISFNYIYKLGFPTKIAKLDFRENFRSFSKKHFAIFEQFSRKFSTPFLRKFSRKRGQYFRENRSTSKSVNLVISTINKLSWSNLFDKM